MYSLRGISVCYVQGRDVQSTPINNRDDAPFPSVASDHVHSFLYQYSVWRVSTYADNVLTVILYSFILVNSTKRFIRQNPLDWQYRGSLPSVLTYSYKLGGMQSSNR